MRVSLLAQLETSHFEVAFEFLLLNSIATPEIFGPLFSRSLETRTRDTQIKLFFSQIPNFMGLIRQIGPKILGAFGVRIFVLSISTDFGKVSPFPCFALFNHHFYKKLSKPLYPHPKYLSIMDWDLNLGHKKLGIHVSVVHD